MKKPLAIVQSVLFRNSEIDSREIHRRQSDCIPKIYESKREMETRAPKFPQIYLVLLLIGWQTKQCKISANDIACRSLLFENYGSLLTIFWCE